MAVRGVGGASGAHDFGDLLGGDADGAVEGDAGAGEESGEEVALIAFDVGEEAAGVEGAAAFAGDDEGEVVAAVGVAVFEAGAPHHDAVVEERAVAFADAVHFGDHGGELGDIEGGDGGDLVEFVGFVVVMGL